MSTMPDRAARDAFSALLQTRSAVLADVDLDSGAEERLLVRSDLSGTMQLYELRAGELVELTALSEPVAGAHYIPRTRRAVLEIDDGGNERHQLYLLELDAPAPATSFDRLENLTGDGRFGHHFAGVSHDGASIAYVSNRGNGVDFDLWLYDLAGAEHRCCYAAGAWCQPASGFSPDDRFVSVLRPGRRPLDTDLVLVEVATGDARLVLEHRRRAGAGRCSRLGRCRHALRLLECGPGLRRDRPIRALDRDGHAAGRGGRGLRRRGRGQRRRPRHRGDRKPKRRERRRALRRGRPRPRSGDRPARAGRRLLARDPPRHCCRPTGRASTTRSARRGWPATCSRSTRQRARAGA